MKTDNKCERMWLAVMTVSIMLVASGGGYSVAQAAWNTGEGGTAAGSIYGSYWWTAYTATQVAQARDVAVDSSGNVYSTGRRNDGAGSNYLTAKHDNNGNLLWEAEYDGGGYDEVAAIVVDDGGNVYVTGSSHNGADFDYVTVKYDTDGNQLWVAVYDSLTGDDKAAGLTLDSSDNVYVTGRSDNGSDSDFSTVKYDNAGAQQWVMRHDSGDEDRPVGVGVDSAGNIYVGGTSSGGADDDLAVVKYDGAGVEQWVKAFDGGGSEGASAMAVDGSGNVHIVGHRNSATGVNFIAAKYDSAGNLAWAVSHDSGAGHDAATAVALDSAGNVYVAGQAGGVADYDYTTVKYNASGEYLWVAQYDQGTDDVPSAVAVDAGGNVIVTGAAGEAGAHRLATVVYDASGSQVGLRVTGDADNDTLAGGIALGPDNLGSATIHVAYGRYGTEDVDSAYLISKLGVVRPDLTAQAVAGPASAMLGQTVDISDTAKNLKNAFNGVLASSGPFDVGLQLYKGPTSNPVEPITGEDVVWTDVVNATVSGTTLSNNDTTTAGSAQVQQVIYSDGGITFKAAPYYLSGNGRIDICLWDTSTASCRNKYQIKYCRDCGTNFADLIELRVWGAGADPTIGDFIANISTNDALGIKRTGTTLTFTRNGSTVFTSPVLSIAPLEPRVTYIRAADLNEAKVDYIKGLPLDTAGELISLGSRTITNLAPNVSDSGTTSVTIPATVVEGDYVYVATADVDGAVLEANEDNNARAGGVVSIADVPDLVPTALSGTAEVFANGEITVDYTINNTRDPDAGGFDARFVLSPDGVIGNGDDINLGTAAVSGLSGNSSLSDSAILTVPGSVAAGSYNLGVIVDDGGTVSEVDETNNSLLAVSTIAVLSGDGPDLTVSSLSAPLGATVGSSITVNNTVQAAVTANAGAFDIGIYLSPDSVITTADTLLGSRSVSSLLAGDSSADAASVTIPAGTAQGGYYVGVMADSGDAVAENTESNNTAATAITIGLPGTDPSALPDLQVTDVTGPVSAAPGDTISVSTTVQNVLEKDITDPFKLGIYLSSDTVISTGDIFLGERSLAGLAGNSADTASTSVTLPAAGSELPDAPNQLAGTVGLWHFNNDWLDASGNGNHGGFTTGQLNQALAFDGVDDYVSLPVTGIDPAATDFTAEVWVKVNQLPSSAGRLFNIMQHLTGTGQQGRTWIFISNTTDTFISYLGGTATDSGVTVTPGTWYHVALTNIGGTLQFYVNGSAAGSGSVTLESANGGLQLGAAANPDFQLLDGVIDEVAVYNIALDGATIQSHYNDGVAGQELPDSPNQVDGTMGLWHFNGDASDTSGNGNEGTLNNRIPATFTADSKLGSHAADFDGVDDYVDMGDYSSLDLGNSDFTISFWTNFTRPTDSWSTFVYTRGTSDPYRGLDIAYENRDSFSANPEYRKIHVQLDFGSTSTGKLSSATDIADGAWHFVTAVREGDVLRLYIDGAEEASTTGAAGDISMTGNVLLGAWGSTTAGFLNGSMDELAIYNTALDAATIQNQYNDQVVGGISPGTYYLGAIADYEGVIAEVDDSNNASVQTDVNGDPEGTAVSVSTTDRTGLSHNITSSNNGGGAMGLYELLMLLAGTGVLQALRRRWQRFE